MWGWVHIKRLRDGDEELLRTLLVAFKPGGQSDYHLQQLLGRNDVHLLVAITNDAPIGFLFGYELPRLSTADKMMFIYELEVAPEHRRKGVGKLLIEAVLNYCHLQGFSKAFVISDESNEAGMKLYQAVGGRRPRSDDAVFKFDTRSG